ncbi:ArnT family glycosyltransferase [Geitlerinema calcuttense]|uniref:Glycosyltransferase family 39 protein n=1 Tax=Geitlerinema calcuttense NRMC-F 0142 TaxID=2922238 RepID=A0ABT7LY81_9CYAN|nr:glycosyltransferase family 39 protein [Geitlerinema calcuttense]MDL5056948.1 glycosyltransferase family 39 protein [Geitlerinema calcuttense NRMC-F 0142]
MKKLITFFRSVIDESLAARHGAKLLILAGLLILLPGTGTIPLIDRDEPRFGQATREMMDRGEWVIPYFNGEYRFDKPVMTYWLMRVFYQFGIHELTSRLHSALFTILTALVMYWWGRRLFGALAGFWGALAFMASVQILIHGRSNVADMPMVFAVTLSMWAVYELLQRGEKSPAFWKDQWFWTLYLAQGFGFLAKGPITQAVVILSLLLYRFLFWRKAIPWSHLRILPGIVVILLVVGIWGIPALIQTSGLFWNVGIGQHVVARGVEEFNQRSSAFLYYFGSVFLSLAPWIALGGFVLRNLRGEWTAPKAFLVAWFAALFVIFTPYATRLPHYIMPGFPAFFLLLGHLLATPETMREGKRARQFFQVVTAIYYLVMVFLLLAPLVFKVDGFARDFLMLMFFAGCLLGCLLYIMDQARGKTLVGHMTVSLLALAGVTFMLANTMRSLSPVVALERVLRRMRGFRPSRMNSANRHWFSTGTASGK